jgi:hypothetical protein
MYAGRRDESALTGTAKDEMSIAASCNQRRTSNPLGRARIRIISTQKKSLSSIAIRLCRSLVHGRLERAGPYTLEKMRNFSAIGGAAI